MSCDYAVWHTQTRLTDAEAACLYDALCDGDTSGVWASAAIDAFYAELTSLHPEIGNVPQEKLDDPDFSPWSIAMDRSPGHLIMCCVWSKAEYVGDLVRTLARKHSLTVFDPQATEIFYPDVLMLAAEGEPTRRSPSLADLRALVGRMTLRKSSSFAILEGRGQDYAQTLGEGGVFVVEWREYRGDSFRHWQAGIRQQPAAKDSSVGSGLCGVQVYPNERLSATDVVTILSAYLSGDPRPEQYLWRDISDMFA